MLSHPASARCFLMHANSRVSAYRIRIITDGEGVPGEIETLFTAGNE
jgi:hypothetical protein